MKTKNERNDTHPPELSLPKYGSACIESAQPGKAVLRPVDRRAINTRPYGLKQQANGLRNHSPARFTAGRPHHF